MRKRIKKPYIAAIFVAFFVLFSVKNALATTNIDNCTILNTTGETYLLTADIINSTFASCIQINNNSITLNCQGFLIDGDYGSFDVGIQNSVAGAVYFNSTTVKNCRITDWGANGILFGLSINNLIQNNTFVNNYDTIYLQSDENDTIINNTISDAEDIGIFVDIYGNDINITGNNITNNYYGIYVDQLNDSIITKNILSNTGEDMDLSNTFNTKIYNNLFNSSYYVWDDGDFVNEWNTTLQNGVRVYSAGTQIGGNYYTNSTGNGYSDTCTDLLLDGFCDVPVNINHDGTITPCEAVTDGYPACNPETNDTDWLPLSAFYEEPCVPSWNCTAWGECVRGYQTRECVDDNECQNETGKPTELQVCLSGLPNASFNVSTAGCCPISTIYCTNNETLLQVWNTSEGLSWASQNCPYGCDNATSMCVPVPYQQNLWLLIIFAVIVVIGLAFIRWVR